MSLMAQIINLGVKMSGMKKKYFLPEKEFLAEVRKMNRSRGFYMPNDKKAVYKKHMVMGRECLIVQKTEKQAEKAILYFFGGGMMIGPDTDVDANLRKAREYNRRHLYKEPADRKAAYKTIYAGGYPCLVIRQRHTPPSGKAILFLHGGGDRDTWKPEVAFARTYGKRAGMDVFYPLYPPFTEASPARTADLILAMYRKIAKKYGADKLTVIGNSYGGFLAMQLLTWINRNNADEENERIEMPQLLIMNSPFGYPKTNEEWTLARELEKIDVMLPVGAFRYMLDLTRKIAPDTPDYALYPVDMDFHSAPETYVFYAEEACAAVADAIKGRYERDGSGDKMHMHREPGMMHCYATAPVFRESRRDFNKQIDLLRQI